MKEIFLISLLLKQDFLSYFCYILNVFTIVFFECFCVCFCEFFFLVFLHSSHIHIITIQCKTI